MNIKSFIKKIIFPNTYSNDAYKTYLMEVGGVKIGKHTVVYAPNHTFIDTNKKHMISIGDYCKITSGVTILSHDYSRSVASRVYGQFIGGTLPVNIGDNVFIGEHATILMGTNIGNNCIIGANSVVKGDFPDNVVIAGNPAKIICTLEEYYKKAKDNWVNDAKKCAETIFKLTGRKPTVEEMTDSYFELYLPHNKETIEKYEYMFNRSADDKDQIIEAFLNSEPLYNSFEDFLKECNI
ncbi:acyltransferase [Clostridium perfringens]|uniref:acyltransferase n=1 Tax=Clostridium perfringens TaxID=1502 RepID=UPI001C84F3A4|nr:acyltransferase [Clostridium perfringens]MDK0562937.1 acyltransferase [Clostridium perfringens]MDK0661914.1 acyltransferase [Clostridium perfringens]MDK0694941.1 acyltransferase [Clostridium perfringens]MDM0519123.1 acyltransferase [Clostridium perfringens]MDM0662790.1 acyltransferase [Clostridium perfringens]